MTLSLQFISLLLMTLSGVLVGAIIEGTRFITESSPRRSFIFKYRVALEIVVWILLGLGTFYILFNVRDGIWRIYDPLAQIVGILLYEQFFQPVFRLAGRIFLRLVVKPIWFIIRMLTALVHKIVQFFLFIIAILLKPFLFLYYKMRRLALLKKPNFSYNKKYTKKLK